MKKKFYNDYYEKKNKENKKDISKQLKYLQKNFEVRSKSVEIMKDYCSTESSNSENTLSEDNNSRQNSANYESGSLTDLYESNLSDNGIEETYPEIKNLIKKEVDEIHWEEDAHSKDFPVVRNRGLYMKSKGDHDTYNEAYRFFVYNQTPERYKTNANGAKNWKKEIREKYFVSDKPLNHNSKSRLCYK